MKILYSELRKEEGEKVARSIALKILAQNNGNVSKAADIMDCSRKCIRRARDGLPEDNSRRPIRDNKRKLRIDWEELILEERVITGYGRIRMRKHILLKYGIEISSNTIRNVYRRNKVKSIIYKRSSNESKPLYDYENILPFEYIQVDTKHIEDFGALGKLAFIPRKKHLPLYQWTAIDAKTKIRFLAYSYTLSPMFGKKFIEWIILHLRGQGILYHLNIQTDNGPADFCGGSKRKEGEWNRYFEDNYNVSFTTIPAGKKYLQGIVERSHRTDDEELYRPKLGGIENVTDFMYHTNKFVFTYNMYRHSYGRGMDGKTPLEKLRESNILYAERFLDIPVILLEDLVKIMGGTDVSAHYQSLLKKLI